MNATPVPNTTEGSARPKGGREAPALGGGSGAARFARVPSKTCDNGVAR